MLPLKKGFLYTTCCAFALALPANILAQGGDPAPPSQITASSGLPDSPGTAWSKAQDASTPQQSSSSQRNAGIGTDGTCDGNYANDPRSRSGTEAAAASRDRRGGSAQSEGRDCGTTIGRRYCSC